MEFGEARDYYRLRVVKFDESGDLDLEWRDDILWRTPPGDRPHEYEVFREAGAEVIGVSSDSIASHERFKEKHRLPFILLSDADGSARRLYGADPLLGLLPKRATFVIDREGVIRLVFSTRLSADHHVEEALRLVRSLSG